MSPGYLYAIGAAVTWGLVYTLDQRILRDVSPFVLLFIDAVINVIVLLPIFLLDRKSFIPISAISGRTWIFVIASLVLAVLANFFIFSSIKILGASTASIFEIAYPFFVVLFTYIAFQSVPSLWFLIGAILIFSGASIIVFFH